MPRTSNARRRSDCPISVSLDIFGDRWSLLIIRDLMFKERREFGEFLKAEEAIATNVLTDRLRQLEEAGLIAKHGHPDDARKFRYRLTAKGLDLAPVLVEMIVWAATHEKTAAPPKVVRQMIRDRAAFIAELRATYKTSIET